MNPRAWLMLGLGLVVGIAFVYFMPNTFGLQKKA